MSSNFLDNLRASAGVVLPPLYNRQGSLGSARTNLSPSSTKNFHVNWGAMNSGLDKMTTFSKFGGARFVEPIVVENKGTGIPLMETGRAQDIVQETPSKNLWRLDGKNADVSDYESMLNNIKEQIRTSSSFEDTAKILRKYAKNWDMNMYLLGTDDGRAQGFYDWSPANMFASEAEIYDTRDSRDAEEWPKDYTNDEWKMYLIDMIDRSLMTKGKRYINPKKVRLI